ncbi:DUF6228 family protein [Microbacterium sp. SLBN-146]|uniref:DUF6228 family protein n=1 Tax=Microbacterium sp. SLBN-146 TaxID=2768457 RepID=UPI00114DC50D|nr:DUF6228 family protein [Microbacterium sp. SLBN-146]TQJ32638.1 hypothetical protein FBY39_3152 [Microbacterium sp. SLBN-146]
MPEARIGGPSEYLLLTPPAPDAPTQAVAVLALSGLNAVIAIEEDFRGGLEGLRTFFGSMEKSWRGWRGTRNWESLEGELRLAATHQGSVIQLKVTIRRGLNQGNDGWTVEGDLILEPGEQLTRIAREVAAFGVRA